ncbi:xylulokinase [Priestia filamentosa]|uniref:xylulokinase n=1 Tax=Priestia filamentosa TaxID=1402861 RepID=UPI002E1E253C|nr:xylulokinase [Priestia filamentosa]MED3727901.1 xylulokinase [Priestia filamentosa]
MTHSYLLGIDVGTQGTKAVVISLEGRVVAEGQSSYQFQSLKAGWAEQHPSVWWEAVTESIRQLWRKGISPHDIKAVGVTGQMHSLVLLGEDGKELREAILWNDVRTMKECKEIEDKIGADMIYDITKNAVLPGFTAPKLLWVKKYEQAVFDKIAHVLMPKDYIVYKLSGMMSADVSDASGTSLFDTEKRDWSAELIKGLGFDIEWFPEVHESSEVVGSIDKKASDHTGLPLHIPVVAGAGDNAAAALGNGIYKESVATISIGTSGTVFTPLKKLPLLKRTEGNTMHLFCHCLPDMWHAMGTTLSAGMSLKWLKEAFYNETYEDILTHIEQVDPGCSGLLFLPYLNGERTPINNPDAKGVFFGMQYKHKQEHFARSVIEGVSFSLKDCLLMIKENGIPVEKIYATGGAVKSKWWTRILADVLQQNLHIHKEREGPAYGASILAGLGIGVWDDVTDLDSLFNQDEVIQYDEKTELIYDKQYRKYKSIYKALEDHF